MTHIPHTSSTKSSKQQDTVDETRELVIEALHELMDIIDKYVPILIQAPTSKLKATILEEALKGVVASLIKVSGLGRNEEDSPVPIVSLAPPGSCPQCQVNMIRDLLEAFNSKKRNCLIVEGDSKHIDYILEAIQQSLLDNEEYEFMDAYKEMVKTIKEKTDVPHLVGHLTL